MTFYAARDPYTAPNFDSSALIVIDVQNDFLDDGPLGVAGTADRLGELERLTKLYRRAGRPIVHVIRLYQGEDVDTVRRSRFEAGQRVVQPHTEGADIPQRLLPVEVRLKPEQLMTGEPQRVGELEFVVWKPRWSAFHRTNLDAILRGLGVDTVVIAGCNFPNCPRASLFDATELDYRAVVVTDATSAVTAERIEDMQQIGVIPVRVADLEDAFFG
ncbi:cysteine hydrolase family protein [Timonella sp. A28]|uniref:cysteine hydrolase family protein n=1 Tax=Timonella sp. A28 TaxID=3442640 RepID=UPI003EBC03F5